jgi:hypothetical protein
MKRSSFTVSVFCIVVLILAISCNKEKPEQTDISNQYNVTTIAGSGVRGHADGSATSSQFDRPHNIVVDGQGNIYVSDYAAYSIRKITKDGMVTTLAGGTRGTADGSGAGAQFIGPGALAIDAQDNIYVADSTRIRKISPSGNVTSVTGSLVPANPSTTLPGVSTNFLEGIALDKQGNIYAIINFFLKSQICKITPTGAVSTFIDSTQNFPTAGYLSTLRNIAIDANGNIYASRNVFLGYEIYKITQSKTVTLLASTPDVYGIAVNSSTGEIFFSGSAIECNSLSSCKSLYRLYKLTAAGKYLLIAGGYGDFADGPGNVARFNIAAGISADAQGNLYLADQENNRIRKISKL